MTATDVPIEETPIRTAAEIRRARVLAIVYLVLAFVTLYAFGLGSEGSAPTVTLPTSLSMCSQIARPVARCTEARRQRGHASPRPSLLI